MKMMRNNMKSKLAVALLAALSLGVGTAVSAQESGPDQYRLATELYGHGMFERAGSLFGEIYAGTGDVTAGGYEALCAVRLQEVGNETLADEYVTAHPYSILVPQIHFYKALNLFDKQDFKAAAAEFDKVKEKALPSELISEFAFKQAYSYFEQGDLAKAKSLFEKSEKRVQSDFTAPSRYSLGYINYSEKNFDEAFEWFEKAARDPRFTEMSNSYMVECRFMKKDYSYVLKNGVKVFENAPKERQRHLARIISESYLAKGDTDKAKEYYDVAKSGENDMDRNDYFYAGSLLFATGDYKGAIDNYSLMRNRTDSIGQIANYNLAYSYIRTGNKVAALDAFKDASQRAFNPDIQEDAHFNYAKLSFDLNHNPSVFNDYMAKYSDKKKGDRIYSYMALASLYSHDYAGAVEAYSNIDMLDKDQKANYMKANYLRAQQLVERGAWSDAVPFLRASSFYADKRSPFSQLSRYWLGESYYRGDQFDKALETFKDLYNNSALEGKAEGRLIPYDLAYCYFRKGDYENAAKWFDEYLASRNPLEGEDASVRRADCDFIRKDYKTAANEYENALTKFPFKNNLYPNYRAGIAYGLLGDMDKKITVLSKALKVNASSEYYPESMFELGRAYIAAGRNDDAVSTFDKLRTTTDDKTIVARSLIELGMISRNMSEYDKSLSYYKQVISAMPGTEYAQDALLAVESIYQSQGRTDEYLDFADKAGVIKDKSESEKESLYFNAAEQVFLTENYDKALTSLKNYLERYPNGAKVPEAEFYVAECYRNTGKKEQACDWYKKAIDRDVNSSLAETAMLNFSRLSYDLQRYNDAFGGYSSLLDEAKLENNKHTARIGMMRSAFKAGNWASALSCADKVLADGKSTEPEIREAEFSKAKSLLSTNEREAAFEIFKKLSLEPSTSEGAESAYMVIQDVYDQGRYEEVEKNVYAFGRKAGDQNYWLAKAFIVLGDSFADQDNFAQAKATFESVLNGYTPASGTNDDILDNVKMRLAKLNDLMK